jgi:hypothetical protein
MALITSYLDIISLERAKNYLRVEDTDLPTLEDQEIESMVKGAFLFIERWTNHLFGARDKEQFVPPKIYDYPINTIDTVPVIDWNNYYQQNMDKLCHKAQRPVLTQYNAGYVNVEDVPDDFIQAALQIIKVWYYEAESRTNDTMLPMSVKQVIDTYRRFV